ncbi:MAG: HAD family hydrolase [Anaerolineae bacterium]|jgi:putative hydrolase of the HAD superfamily
MYRAILFDLGGTLVHVYESRESAAVLAECLTNVGGYLQSCGCDVPALEDALGRIESGRNGSTDHYVYPLATRLLHIYGPQVRPYLDMACRRFMRPIFERCFIYPDTVPTLEALRDLGCRIAVISNTPWGSPGGLWREQIARMGLDRRIDMAAFCDDVGQRKPARLLFDYTLARLDASPRHALVVGDDPRWDIAGARAAGLAAVLIDREGESDSAERVIGRLDELVALVGG